MALCVELLELLENRMRPLKAAHQNASEDDAGAAVQRAQVF